MFHKCGRIPPSIMIYFIDFIHNTGSVGISGVVFQIWGYERAEARSYPQIWNSTTEFPIEPQRTMHLGYTRILSVGWFSINNRILSTPTSSSHPQNSSPGEWPSSNFERSCFPCPNRAGIVTSKTSSLQELLGNAGNNVPITAF
jgi:hypothetical protein